MAYYVPALSIIFMAVAALFGVLIPVTLLILFRKKYKASIMPFFVGAAVFLVFALIIEAILHRIILSSAVGLVIQENIWLYAAYGGLMAGIFEETGRYVAFKTILRKRLDNDCDSLMYGAGHGGFEAFYILTVNMIVCIVMAVMLNSGMSNTLTAGITDEAALKALELTFESLAKTPSPLYLVSVVERLAAVAIHLSLSVLVWFSAKNTTRFWLYPLAIGLHAFIDFIAVILSKSGVNIWIMEGIVYVVAAGFIFIARIVWKKSVYSEKAIGNSVQTEDTKNDSSLM